MLKLLLCLLSTTLIAGVLLHQRQQRLDLNYQANRLHSQIESQQAKLWNQQLQIAIFTAPNAITQTVGDNDLHLVPRSPLPPEIARWIDVGARPSQNAAD